MVQKRAPFLVRACPDKAKQLLAIEYELEDFFGPPRLERYLRWLRKHEASMAELFAYGPTPQQLKETAAPVLTMDPDFGGHLIAKGIVDWETDRRLVKKLSHVGIAILATYYDDVRLGDGS